MNVAKKHFPEILKDNDEEYFLRLIGIVESIDELSSLQITYRGDSYHFRLASSHPKYNNNLLVEILKFHNLYGIRIEMSKSIKTSGTIAFNINLS